MKSGTVLYDRAAIIKGAHEYFINNCLTLSDVVKSHPVDMFFEVTFTYESGKSVLLEARNCGCIE